MKQAYWQITRVTGQTQLTHRQILIDKQTSEELWACSYWPASSRSVEEADAMAGRAEKRFRAEGYAIEIEAA